MAIDVIKRNICYATGLGRNPTTGEFDTDRLFLGGDEQELNKCAQETYDLIEKEKSKDKKDKKKQEETKGKKKKFKTELMQ